MDRDLGEIISELTVCTAQSALKGSSAPVWAVDSGSDGNWGGSRSKGSLFLVETEVVLTY